jgi:hypothetical protein
MLRCRLQECARQAFHPTHWRHTPIVHLSRFAGEVATLLRRGRGKRRGHPLPPRLARRPLPQAGEVYDQPVPRVPNPKRSRRQVRHAPRSPRRVRHRQSPAAATWPRLRHPCGSHHAVTGARPGARGSHRAPMPTPPTPPSQRGQTPGSPRRETTNPPPARHPTADRARSDRTGWSPAAATRQRYSLPLRSVSARARPHC